MRLYVGVNGGSNYAFEEAEWDGLPSDGTTGAYAGLLKAVTSCAGSAAGGHSVLYYVDLCDADEIVVRTDDDVSEFLDHHAAASTPPTIHLRTPAPPPPRPRVAKPPDPSGEQPHRDKHRSVRWSRGHLLGAGATGKVYRAFDKDTGDFLAVKEVLLHGNEDNLRAVKREIELMRPLQHSNIVRYMGIQQTTTALHILMEYVPGGSISSLLQKLGPFGERVIRAYTRQLCLGLQYLHNNGIIHRDIKGGNCLVCTDGTVKLADFGCSVQVFRPGGVQQAPAILDCRHLGTSLWMSPESVRAPSEVTFATDVWSVACTVVEMADGRAPWADAHFTNEWAAMFYISQTKAGPPVPRTLSRQCHEFLRLCFAIDPVFRPNVGQILEHGFASQPFDEGAPHMCPPSPSELPPQHLFPKARRTGSVSPRSVQDHAGSLVSGDDIASVRSFAPMDLRIEDDASVLCEDDDDLVDPDPPPHVPLPPSDASRRPSFPIEEEEEVPAAENVAQHRLPALIHPPLPRLGQAQLASPGAGPMSAPPITPDGEEEEEEEESEEGETERNWRQMLLLRRLVCERGVSRGAGGVWAAKERERADEPLLLSNLLDTVPPSGLKSPLACCEGKKRQCAAGRRGPAAPLPLLPIFLDRSFVCHSTSSATPG
eukprot:Hpha_TRINITY_DN15549_c6_g3::TRINITY_DN15549_c6_g3_i1::g.107209::m.107209